MTVSDRKNSREGSGTSPADARVEVRKPKRDWSTLLLLGPAVVFLALMCAWPLVYLIYAALSTYQLATPTPITFNGLGNFAEILGTPRFWSSLKITAIFGLVNVPIQMIVGLALALLIYRIGRGRQVYTALLLVPMMVAPIVVGYAWDLLLNPIYGPLNALLDVVGIGGRSWTTSAALALPTVMTVDAWQWFPFAMVILLAGLQSIPPRLYEAARIDGSSRWQVFWNITLPLLVPYLAIVFVLRFIDSFKVFDVLFILTKGGPGTRTENLGYYTYELGFKDFNLGTAAAASIFQLVIIAAVTMVALRVLRRRRVTS